MQWWLMMWWWWCSGDDMNINLCHWYTQPKPSFLSSCNQLFFSHASAQYNRERNTNSSCFLLAAVVDCNSDSSRNTISLAEILVFIPVVSQIFSSATCSSTLECLWIPVRAHETWWPKASDVKHVYSIWISLRVKQTKRTTQKCYMCAIHTPTI